MSLLSKLSRPAGSRKTKKRLGRGKGSGKGGTSGKGHKGQKARKGVSIKSGFEGGTMSLSRRLPKFDFTNARFKTNYRIINLMTLQKFSGEVNPEVLSKKGLIRKNDKVKILGQGELKKSLIVKAHKFSKKAKKQIESQGGQAQVL